MKKYELLLVLPGTLDEKEAENRSNEVLSLVKNTDEAAEINPMGKVRLAYPIKQIRYGYYYTIVFSSESEPLKTLQNKLGLMRDLLRAIVSVYNPDFKAQKLPVAGMNEVVEMEKTEEKGQDKPKNNPEAKVSMQEIDKKLDEIMSGDAISGV
jgi:ribosomal protein S6